MFRFNGTFWVKNYYPVSEIEVDISNRRWGSIFEIYWNYWVMEYKANKWSTVQEKFTYELISKNMVFTGIDSEHFNEVEDRDFAFYYDTVKVLPR